MADIFVSYRRDDVGWSARYIGQLPFRKAYLGAIIDRVEADDTQIRILGRKDVLEQAVLANGGPIPGVRSFVPKWRAGQDKSANTYVIEVTLYRTFHTSVLQPVYYA